MKKIHLCDSPLYALLIHFVSIDWLYNFNLKLCSPLDWSDTFLSGLADPAPGLYPSFLSFRTILAFAIFSDFHSEIVIDKISSEEGGGDKAPDPLPSGELANT